jgi:SDR family mycofactocin-dependent oxidoreductase
MQGQICFDLCRSELIYCCTSRSGCCAKIDDTAPLIILIILENSLARLTNKVAFITGAARGIGRSIAIRLAEEGADIIAVDICRGLPGKSVSTSNDEDMAITVNMVEALGRKIIARTADVRSSEQLEAAVAAGILRFGHIDIIVANAGIGGRGPALSLSEQQWQDMIDINLTGVWKTIRAAGPSMIEGGNGGAIVLISSVAGLAGYPQTAHYTAAKHGVVGLMKVLAVEFGAHRIRVNTVHPTTVDTPLIQNEEMYQMFANTPLGATREGAAAGLVGMHVLPIPWVESIDVSNAVLWLSSDEARYVTGVSLPVDAGAVSPFKIPHPS